MNWNLLKEKRKEIAIVVALLAMLAGPLVIQSTFTLNIITSVMVLALFAMSFNLLFGYTGLLSFGHSAFYGTGAYVTVIALSDSAWFIPSTSNFFVAILISILVTTIVAGLIGAVCVQRDEIFFAILTLAFAMLLYELLFAIPDITGGESGLHLVNTTVDFGVFTFDALDSVTYYYFVLLVLVASLLVLYRLVNSPYGRLLTGIRENTERAEFVGVPVKRYQWSAFVISGMFAGLAGALVPAQQFAIVPESMHWSTSANPVFATLIGGPSVFLGPVVGAIVFIGLEEVIVQFTQFWKVGIGLVLIPIVLFLHGGILGYLTDKSWSGHLETATETVTRLLAVIRGESE